MKTFLISVFLILSVYSYCQKPKNTIPQRGLVRQVYTDPVTGEKDTTDQYQSGGLFHFETNTDGFEFNKPILYNGIDLISLTDTASELISKMIYINQNTGNDTIGTGLIGSPFRTFGKAIRAIKKVISTDITFIFSIGNHNIYQSDIDYLSNNIVIINNKGNNAYLKLLGTMFDISGPHSFTKDPSNSFKMSTTGVSWLSNSFEGCFVRNVGNTSFNPIESNTESSVEGSFSLLANGSYYITKDSTILNFVGLNNTNGLVINLNDFTSTQFNVNTQPSALRFEKVNIKVPTLRFLSISGKNSISFNYCKISNSNNACFVAPGANLIFLYSFFKTNLTSTGGFSFTSYFNSAVYFYFSIIKNSSNSFGVAIPSNFNNNVTIQYSVISNFLKAFSYTHTGTISVNASLYVKNCTYLIYSTNEVNSTLNLSGALFNISGITHLIYSTQIPSFLYLNLNSNIGFTNIYDPASSFKGVLVDVSKNINILIPNTYPEYQQKSISNLNNNSTDSIAIADLTYNRTIDIDYVIIRNSQYRYGKLNVLNTGTTYLLSSNTPLETADVGVTFNGVYRSGTSNTLKLKWTTTNTGSNASIQMDFKRQNF